MTNAFTQSKGPWARLEIILLDERHGHEMLLLRKGIGVGKILLMTWRAATILFCTASNLAACAGQDAVTLFSRAQAGCASDHPMDQPAYRTARALCVEAAGNLILVPTLTLKLAAARREVWTNDVLLAQQVDDGKITSEQAAALSVGLLAEMLSHGN